MWDPDTKDAEEEADDDDDDEENTLFEKLTGDKQHVMMVSHEAGFIAIMVFALLTLLVTVFVNLEQQPIPEIQIKGFTLHGFKNISETYRLEITPPWWIHSVWGAVFIWQTIWMMYCLVCICRKTSEGPLYLSPVVHTKTFLFLYTLGLACDIGWIFLWDRLYISIAFIFAFLRTFCLFGSLAISYKMLSKNLYVLKSSGRHSDIWLIRILVQNGIAFYATWSAIVTFFDFGSVLAFSAIPKIDTVVVSIVVLALHSAFVLFYFLLDIFLMDKYSRYILSPYMAQIVALIGIFLAVWMTSKVIGVFSLVLLAAACTLTVIKLFYLCLQEMTTPKEKELDILRELDETRRLLK